MVNQLILSIAKTVGVSGQLLLAICTHESHLQNVAIIHDHGSPSYGLCQVKEDTARSLGYRDIASGPLKETDIMPDAMVSDGVPEGLMKPSVNIKYAALYLKMQMKRYSGDWNKAIAAYNAGSFKASRIYNGMPTNFHYLYTVLQIFKELQYD